MNTESSTPDLRLNIVFIAKMQKYFSYTYENSVIKKTRATSVIVSLQTVGSRRNGVTMCRSSAGVSTQS